MPFPSGPVRDLIMLAGGIKRILSRTLLGHIGAPRRVTAGRRQVVAPGDARA
ncbi:hypothetical protein [Streptosporangium sp. CA-115845]|uniref:hypothetical protein n=1 Tax=Streptosporangium sp. CA-115845 TaxID=3240071 RepID=UPI003D91CA5C